MKVLFGSPGRLSGLVLRMGQCSFAASSIGIMLSASGYSGSTAFCYLIASMGLQILWSFALACVDMQALRLRRNLQHPVLLSLFVVGDWVTSLLSLAAASASAGVVLLYARDLNYCSSIIHPPCAKFQISVALAFISWFLLAISSYVMFWLLCSV
ncbi:hypothetical protein PVL29_016704 [Vitis rotundifolia]|uniref:CASP-like protein n=1 Tax=Vitis rotundifolia TaxID=103349 RepID=A0AA38Z991_VITRO|nr:hypothetical protein PVL29_016704 [Vitis rotundifolia]